MKEKNYEIRESVQVTMLSVINLIHKGCKEKQNKTL